MRFDALCMVRRIVAHQSPAAEPVRFLVLGPESDIVTEWVALIRKSGLDASATTVSSLSELRGCLHSSAWDLILCTAENPKASLVHIATLLRHEKLATPAFALNGYSPKQITNALKASDTVADLVLDEPPAPQSLLDRGMKQLQQWAAGSHRECNETRFRRIADLAPLILWKTNAKGEIIFLNQRWQELRGHPAEMDFANGWAAGTGEASGATFHPALAKASAAKSPFSTEFQLRRWDGAMRLLHATGTPQYDHNQRFIGYLGSCRDITNERPWAAELQFGTRLLHALADITHLITSCENSSQCECAPEMLKILGQAVDADRAYIFTQRVQEKSYAMMADQLYEWCSEHAKPEIDNPALQDVSFDIIFERLYRVLKGGFHFASLVKDLSPEAIAFLRDQNIQSLLCAPIFISGRLWGFIGLDDCRRERIWSPNEIALVQGVADIYGTLISREQSEKSIAARNRLLRYIAQATHELLTTPTTNRAIERSLELLGSAANVDRTWLLINSDAESEKHPAVRVYAHWSREPLTIVPPEASVAYDDMLPGSYDTLESGRTISGIMADFLVPRGPDGLPPLRRMLLAPVVSGNRFWGLIGISTTDLSSRWGSSEEDLLKAAASAIGAALARRDAETALREREEHYRSLIEHVSDIIAIIDSKGALTYASPALESTLGYSPSELLNHSVAEILHPDDAYALIQVRRIIVEDPSVIRTIEFRLRHRDGTWRDFESAAKALHVQGRRRHYVINARDITERKKSEAALRRSEELLQHAQKMEAVGRLAGGIAHDFNNLLTVITGYAEALRAEVPAGNPMHSEADEIVKAAERAFGLTRQLLAFSRKQVLEPRPHDLNAIVQDIKTILRRLISEDIEIQTELTSDPGLVRVDAGQVEQMIINLALNARDAMPNGGRLIIRTSRQDLTQRLTRGTFSVEPGPYTVLEVRDNGKGMDDSIKAHIFEPFFTTKEVGKGTGLGLPMVYGIAQQSGGHILVDSTPGLGTSISIYLPRTDGHVMPAPRTTPTETRRGTETILLVEDEDSVRKLTARLLTQHGYTVTTASNGREALDIVRRDGRHFNLLLTDIVMPHISGTSLAEQLRTLQPEIKILYMSGYADEALTGATDVEPGRNFLQKPFKPAALATIVREVLDAR